ILPEANRGHFEELPDYLKEGLTVHFAKRYGDVAKVLFPA
ncbi:S16 family serine protease, partial [Pseudomonas aeruginosa]